MTEVLKCPECSAPLDYPSDGAPAVKCSFCGSTVMLPHAGSGRIEAGNAAFASGLGPMVGKALELAQMANLVRSGQKIDAIRIYRQSFGSDLLTAKNAIDSLSSGRPILLNTAKADDVAQRQSLQYAPAGAKRNGAMIAIVLALVVGFFLILAMFGLRSVSSVPPPVAIVSVPVMKQFAPPPVFNLPAVPAETPFATLTMQFGSEGIGPGQFVDDRTIALDARGHIYVGEYSNSRVQVFDTSGKFVKVWSVGAKTSLLGLSASRDGTVYAVTPGHILCFEGATGLAMGEAAVTHDDMQYSYMDAFAAPSGDIYAISGHEIVILNSDGRIKSAINTSDKVGEDISPIRVAVNGTGEIYALDRTKGIFRFAADGRYINRFGTADLSNTNDPSSIISAQALTIDGKGRVYASGVNPAIRVFSADGRYLAGLGKNQVAFGLAIDDQDNLFACFRNDHQVREFAPAATK